ncbi:MAG: DUF3800 domain-containing protein [Desulfitobacteriaceae bacterium]
MKQISFDDLHSAEESKKQPGRTAFIDECGNYGFDFTKEGTSKFFIVCAVIIKNADISQLEIAVETIRRNNFGGSGEMKSSRVAADDKRRIKIINEIIQLDFSVILLIADKERFYKGSPLTNYKDSFIKYLRQRLYMNLYYAYPKLHIFEDKMGYTEFQTSFKKYVISERPEINLFDEYDFDFVDSKNTVLIQLADLIAGTIGRQLVGGNTPNYQSILHGKILHTEKFPSDNGVNLNPAADNSKYNKEISNLAFRKAKAYISEHEEDENIDKRLQVGFLKYLVFEAQYGNPYKFITSGQILSVLSKYSDNRVTKDFLYRKIIAPLRDAKVILASSPQGYKLPISIEDISAYLHQTNSIISPMLHRMGLCREVIRQQTDGKLDVIDDVQFLKYKKYFD